MTRVTPQCLWPVGALLGEGPVWHGAEQALYFVDIKGRHIHRLCVASGRRDSWATPGQPGFIVPQGRGSLVCGMDHGLHGFRPDQPLATRFMRLLPVEPDLPGNRLNDGHVDASGRLWFGSMDDGETEASGALYSFDIHQGLVQRDSGYVISNGPATSPCGRILYHTDTVRRRVFAFDLASDGTLSRKRIFLEPRGPGHPDGMAVDAEGCLWVAFFGGWRIDRYAPSGRLLDSVRLPCANVTKLAFGGQDLRTVYVTTARKGLTQGELEQQPLAGGLFSFRVAMAGLGQSGFAGAWGN